MKKRTVRNIRAIKKDILNRDGNACHYCGQVFPAAIMQLDHKVPRAIAPDLAYEPWNLVIACPQCNARKGATEYSRYLAELYGATTHARTTFRESLGDARKLIELSVPDNLKDQHLRMLHANLITIMETFLSDALLSQVMTRADLRRRVIETAPEFRQQRFNLSEIYDRFDSVDDEVKVYLGSQLYHNLAKILPLYEAVLDVVVSIDISDVFRAIEARHDIVHRNGKDKDGNRVQVSRGQLDALATQIEKFVNHVADQLPDTV